MIYSYEKYIKYKKRKQTSEDIYCYLLYNAYSM